MDRMTQTADRLLNRISVSTCSFTTTAEAIRTLAEQGFKELRLSETEWQAEPGGNYYIKANDSTCLLYTSDAADDANWV